MKRIFKLTTLFLGLGALLGLASCTSSKSSVDNKALQTNVANEWLYKNGEITYNNNLNTLDIDNSPYTLSLPDVSLDDMIRMHQTEVSNKMIKQNDGVVKVLWASTSRQSVVSAYSEEISEILVSNKDYIESNITLFDASLQATYEYELSVLKSSDTKYVVCAYVPMMFRVYSDAETVSLVTFILVPVYTTYTTVSNAVYQDSVVENNKDLFISWSSTKYGALK